VDRPRAVDDFATIRARMDELRHERERASQSNRIRHRSPSEPATAAVTRSRCTEPVEEPGYYAGRGA